MVENGGRKGGRQCIDGLCVVTKTNVWKTVICESEERWRNECLTIFLVESQLKLVGGWRSVGRMEGVRNVLKVSALNYIGKERKYLRDIESVKTVKFKFEYHNFYSSFPMSQKCPTMSLHQEASSTSSLI